MSKSSPQEVTQLLLAWSSGNTTALDKLVPLVHSELRRLARHHLRQLNPDHLLQTTALVNEAYLRLISTLCLEEKERAIEWLEKAYEERLPRLNDLKINHFWNSLRPDPRFRDLLRQMNIPP
jgi:hypothetical protein